MHVKHKLKIHGDCPIKARALLFAVKLDTIYDGCCRLNMVISVFRVKI